MYRQFHSRSLTTVRVLGCVQLISAGQDSRVQLYDLREKAHIHTFDKHVSSIQDKNAFLVVVVHNRTLCCGNQTWMSFILGIHDDHDWEKLSSLGFTPTAAGDSVPR